jgi:cytochrome b pre-mRNA-processing protein 3
MPWQVWGLRLFGYFRPASLRIRQAQAMYRSSMLQADSPSLRRGLGLPMDGFAPQHQLLLIHLWIINKRLLAEGKPGKKLQVELFDTLWENTERRIRRAGIQELSVNKSLAEIQKLTFGAMVAYDIGLKKTDDNDQELGSAIWRNLFASRSEVPDETVLSVCRWMRSEVERIKKLPMAKVEEGELEWTLPEGIKVTEGDKEYMRQHGMEGEWRSELAVNGQIYWWNTKTREAQWEKPASV